MSETRTLARVAGTIAALAILLVLVGGWLMFTAPQEEMVEFPCASEDSCTVDYDGERNVYVITRVVP